MIPKKVKIGCYTYKIIQSKAKVADTHGLTSIDNKEIVIYKTDNDEAMRETLQHEILHALLEDVIDCIKDIEDPAKMEEQLIRLLSPRLMSFVLDNKDIARFIWKMK